MTHLYFVRHGQSKLNAAGRIAGATDTPLTDEGRLQASETGKKAKDLGIEHIIASPLSRAHDTAKHIAQEIGYPEDKIEVNPMFVERNYGAMEGALYVPYTNYDEVEGAETTKDLLARSERAVEYLESLPYKKILVVAHGSLGRALRHHMVAEQPFHMPIKYANAELVEWTARR